MRKCIDIRSRKATSAWIEAEPINRRRWFLGASLFQAGVQLSSSSQGVASFKMLWIIIVNNYNHIMAYSVRYFFFQVFSLFFFSCFGFQRRPSFSSSLTHLPVTKSSGQAVWAMNSKQGWYLIDDCSFSRHISRPDTHESHAGFRA